MLSVAGVVATNPIPHLSLLGHIAKPAQQLATPHAVPGHLVNLAQHAAPRHLNGTLPIAARTHHQVATHTSTSATHQATAKSGAATYNGQNPFAKTPTVHAAVVTTTDPTAGMTPTAATDPTAYEPYAGPTSSVCCNTGDTVKVDIILFQRTNNSGNDTNWKYTGQASSELNVQGTATIGGKVFSGGIQGSLKTTQQTTEEDSGTLKDGQSIYIIAHYTFTCKPTAGGPIARLLKGDCYWDGTLTSVTQESSPPKSPVDIQNSGPAYPTPQS